MGKDAFLQSMGTPPGLQVPELDQEIKRALASPRLSRLPSQLADLRGARERNGTDGTEPFALGSLKPLASRPAVQASSAAPWRGSGDRGRPASWPAPWRGSGDRGRGGGGGGGGGGGSKVGFALAGKAGFALALEVACGAGTATLAPWASFRGSLCCCDSCC